VTSLNSVAAAITTLMNWASLVRIATSRSLKAWARVEPTLKPDRLAGATQWYADGRRNPIGSTQLEVNSGIGVDVVAAQRLTRPDGRPERLPSRAPCADLLCRYPLPNERERVVVVGRARRARLRLRSGRPSPRRRRVHENPSVDIASDCPVEISPTVQLSVLISNLPRVCFAQYRFKVH